MTLSIDKKLVLITGANKGIGYEMASQLGNKGYLIIITARNPKLGKKALEQLRHHKIDCDFIKMDVTKPDQIQEAVKYVESQFGRLDILINNAGIFLDVNKKITEISMEEFRTTMEVNVFGVFQVIQAFLPLLKKSSNAKIINISSDLGALTQASDSESKYDCVLGPSYRISKAALNMITLTFAKELRNSNITINSVTPGWCKTDLGGESAPNSAAQGADTSVWLITNEKNLHGEFFGNRTKIGW